MKAHVARLVGLIVVLSMSVPLIGPPAPISAQPSPPVRAQAETAFAGNRGAPTLYSSSFGGIIQVFRQNLTAQLQVTSQLAVVSGSLRYELHTVVPPDSQGGCYIVKEVVNYPAVDGFGVGSGSPNDRQVGIIPKNGTKTQTYVNNCQPEVVLTNRIENASIYYESASGNLRLCLFHFAVLPNPPCASDSQALLLDGTCVTAAIAPQALCQDPDLEATGLEVTQAIQDVNNSVTLVAGKRTVVRFYVRATDSVNNVAASLAGFRTNQGNPVSLGPPLAPLRNINVSTTPQRSNLHDSFTFELPEAWTAAAGSISLTARVNPPGPDGVTLPTPEGDTSNNSVSRTVNLRTVRPLRLRILQYQFQPTGGAIVSPTNNDVDMLVSQLRRMFPVGELRVFRRTFLDHAVTAVPTAAYVNGLAQGLRAVGGSADANTVWYTMVADTAGFMRGEAVNIPALEAAGPTGPSTPTRFGWDTDGNYGDWYGAHEIGHALNQHHIPFCGADPEGVPNPSYPFGLIGGPADNFSRFFGFDVGDAAVGIPARIVPNLWTDVMSYCNNIWISDTTYQRLFDYINALGSLTAPGVRPAATGDYLRISGSIDEGTGAATFPFVARQAQVASIPTITPGPYRLRLLAANGAQLIEHAFTPSVGTEGSITFNLVVDFIPGVRRIAVVSAATGQELGFASVSAHAPTVAVTQRTGGPTLTAGGQVTLSWTGADADGDPLTYDVLYSFDNGATWRAFARTKATATIVPVAELEGTGGAPTGVFRITANDGVLTGSADSDHFTVVGQAPSPRISSPTTGATVQLGQSVTLAGSAEDFEDGTLLGSQLRWSSSRDGVLGTGAALAVTNLTAGVHTLTLRATDSGGLIGETAITLTVAGTLPTVGPTLEVNPTTLDFTYTPGGPNPPGQTVSVRNLGSGAVAWNASAPPAWVTLSALSGAAPADLTASINMANLPAGTTHTAQITFTASGAAGSPRVLTIRATVAPPTSTATPLVSPTQTATGTALPTPTRTPTATPAAVAGRQFALQAGAQPVLTWQGGTETGVLVIRWDAIANQFAFLPPPANPLGFLVNTYIDPGPLPGQTYCYVLLVLGSNPPSISDVRGLSDLHCLYPQTATGTPPTGFKVRLDQGPIAYLNWNAVPNATSYELTAVRFDGTLPRSIMLQGMATSFAEEHGGLSTCYRLVARSGANDIGGTQQLCAAPGVSSFSPSTGAAPSLPGVLDRLRGQALPGR